MHFNGQVPNYTVSHGRNRNQETFMSTSCWGNDFFTSAHSHATLSSPTDYLKGLPHWSLYCNTCCLVNKSTFEKKPHKLKAYFLEEIIKLFQTNLYSNKHLCTSMKKMILLLVS
jgi:hypothetical protein